MDILGRSILKKGNSNSKTHEQQSYGGVSKHSKAGSEAGMEEGRGEGMTKSAR